MNEVDLHCQWSDHIQNLIYSAYIQYDREMIEDKLFADWNGDALLITEDGEEIEGRTEYLADEKFWWFTSDNKKYDFPIGEL